MELAVKLSFAGIAAAVLALVVKRTNPEYSVLIAAALFCAGIFAAGEMISQIVDFIFELTEMTAVDSTAVSIVLKTVAISIITGVACNMCRDAGQAAMSGCVELVGTISAAYVTLPLLRAVLSVVKSML